MTETPPSTAAGKHEPHLAAPDVNPSFTKSVFLGEVREDLIFPFLPLTNDEKESLAAILDSMHDWGCVVPGTPRKFDHDGRVSRRGPTTGSTELGLMGLSIPEKYAGFGASPKVTIPFFGKLGSNNPAPPCISAPINRLA